MLLLLFSLSISFIPDEFKELKTLALENARVKVPKEEREDTMQPGYYEGPNYHFQLKRPLTCSNTKDIKGFAAKNNYIAIVKRKNFALKDGFIFIEPQSQKLYKLRKTVASDEDVQIYESKETSIFHIMTNFRIHTKITRSDNYENNNGTFKNPLETKTVRKAINFHWDSNKKEPKLEPIQKTQLQFGYGAYTSIEAELDYTFNLWSDVQLKVNIILDSYVGAKFVIPDGFSHTFKVEKFKKLSLGIPNLSFNKKLLKRYDLKIGVFMNLQASLESLVLDVPIGFQYYRGYRFYGSKSIIVTPSQTFDTPWKYSFVPLGEDNKGYAKDLLATILSAKLTATFPIHLFLSFDVELGDIKTSIDAGLNFPFQIVLGINTKACQFPYLTVTLVFPIQMTLTLNELKFKLINIWKEKKSLLDISAKITVGPKCLATNLASLRVKKKVATSAMKIDEVDEEINPVHEDMPSQEDINKIDGIKEITVVEYTLDDNHVNPDALGKIPDGEDSIILRVTIPSIYKGGKLLSFHPGFNVIIDGATVITDEACYIDITGNKLNIMVTLLPEFNDIDFDQPIMNLAVVNFMTGSLDPLFDLQYTTFKKDFLNLVCLPFYGESRTMCYSLFFDGIVEPYDYLLIYGEGGSYIIPFVVPSDNIGQIFNALVFLADEQPSLTVDFSYLQNIEFDNDTVEITILCEYTDTVLMEYDLNGEHISVESEAVSYMADFMIPYKEGLNITFSPVCNDEKGIMCLLDLEKPTFDGYYILRYPNRDGISITGKGFLVEVLPINKGEVIRYYKYVEGSVQIIKKYSYDDVDKMKFSVKIESIPASNSLLEEERKRICIYNDVDGFIIPFSRTNMNENMDELYEILGIMIESDDDYSNVDNDEDGCIIAPAKILTKDEIKFSDLSISVIDIKPRNDKSNNNKLSKGQIAGIVVGVILGVAVIVTVVIVIIYFKKKKAVANSSEQNSNEKDSNEKDSNEKDSNEKDSNEKDIP